MIPFGILADDQKIGNIIRSQGKFTEEKRLVMPETEAKVVLQDRTDQEIKFVIPDEIQNGSFRSAVVLKNNEFIECQLHPFLILQFVAIQVVVRKKGHVMLCGFR